MKIVAEDKIIEQKTHELLQEWEKKKPVQVPSGERAILTVVIMLLLTHSWYLEWVWHTMCSMMMYCN